MYVSFALNSHLEYKPSDRDEVVIDITDEKEDIDEVILPLIITIRSSS